MFKCQSERNGPIGTTIVTEEVKYFYMLTMFYLFRLCLWNNLFYRHAMLATPVEEEGEEENKINSGKEQSFPDESQATECCPWNDNKERRTNSTSQLHQFHGVLPKDLGQKIHNGVFSLCEHLPFDCVSRCLSTTLCQHQETRCLSKKDHETLKISGNSL